MQVKCINFAKITSEMEAAGCERTGTQCQNNEISLTNTVKQGEGEKGGSFSKQWIVFSVISLHRAPSETDDRIATTDFGIRGL